MAPTRWSSKTRGHRSRQATPWCCRSGFHGEFYMQGAYNEYTITIAAAVGHRPTLSAIFLSAGANWHFIGLAVSPSESPAYERNAMAVVDSHSWHGPSRDVVIDNCEFYSVPDISAWSADDWNTLACNAIQVSGDCMTVVDNTCRNVDFGISVDGNNVLVSENLVENFAGDGLRGIGNDQVFEFNTVRNCYDVNDNHDDGFQSFSVNGDPPRERVVLRGNVIIGYTDPEQPYRGTLQGIGCFDGFYIDWIVENNLVVTDHWHGITLLGADGCRVVNNTVVDLNDTDPGPPWIMIDHKDGRPSVDCLIRNNIAATITATGDTIADHNLLLSDAESLFSDPAGFDFHLRADAYEAIDSGSSLLAPAVDLDGVARPRAAASIWAVMNAEMIAGVSRQTVNELLLERRAVSPAMALRLSKLFGNTPKFRLNAQRAVDLRNVKGKTSQNPKLIQRNGVLLMSSLVIRHRSSFRPARPGRGV